MSAYKDLRTHVLDNFSILIIVDLGKAAFSQGSMLINTSMSIFQKSFKDRSESVAIRLFKPEEIVIDYSQVVRNSAALLSTYERFKFEGSHFSVIKEQPIIYWWSRDFLRRYAETSKLGETVTVRVGLQTGNNTRFIRQVWELPHRKYSQGFFPNINLAPHQFKWQSYIKGASGRKWFEPLTEVIDWDLLGAAFAYYSSARFGRGADCYFHQGVAFPKIGSDFSARIHRYPSIIGDAGCSVFPDNPETVVCLMNSSLSRQLMSDLNPTVNFQVGDVNRLPLFPIESANEIFAQLDRAFTEHEAARETSVEFKQPGAFCWNYAQQWAQQAVDREPGKPLPDWNPVYDQPPAVNWVSWAIGVALGRFPLTPQPPLPKGEGETIQDSLVPLLPGEKGLGDEGLSKLLPGEKGLGDEGFSELAGRERQIPKVLLQRARELRKQQTTAEALLWECLRDRRLQNAKFRRQHNIGQIIADFYCHDAKLIIELDGGIHKHQQIKDQDRDSWAVNQGLTVLRFSNEAVLDQTEQVLTQIVQYLPSSPQPPSPQGEGRAKLPSPSGRGAGGEGIFPHGILYLSAYAGDRPDSKDSLNHPAAQPIKDTWSEYGSQIAKNKPLRDWLRLNFFKDVHVGMYEQRPIYFPLSSKNRNFVAYISIHRWADNTLQTLLADYLIPELRELEGETADLLESQGKGDRKQQAQAEERRATVQALYNELQTFIDLVQQCAEQGPPAANPKDTPRQANAPFRMDLDDGVMVNSAALWCLLEPQWNKPKTWWSELCNAKGKKDYDWSHLAARYFCDRVDEKCQKDPSLAVAHGVFWKYHPAKAYEWELRLQDEIAPDFTIEEEDSDRLRSEFEAKYPQLVAGLRGKEEKRRERKYKKSGEEELPLFQTESAELEEEDE